MKVIIAAGGTGGHINPGIAIANMLKEHGHQVIFVGTERGMENDLVPKAGYPLVHIHSQGLERGMSLKNIGTMVTLCKGISECKRLIKEEKPDLLIGTGGYVTAPLMIAGVSKKVPTMIHESNALPGKTTIWLSSKVDTVALGFEAAMKKLPKAKHAVYTGNPTKMKPHDNKENMKKKLGLDEKSLVLVFGGSQGAKKINEVMVEMINHNDLKSCNLIYATGPKHYEEIMSKIKNIPENVKIEKYIYNMDEVMAASDLLVCRSGALTTSEIGIVGVPAILIPFPYAAENHQYFNAKTLEDVGGAVIIEEKDLSKEKLASMINDLIANKSNLKQMGENARKIGNTKAIEKIQYEVDKFAKLC